METEKKYKLTDECITIYNKTLYRIEAIKDFGSVKKGSKGGFVESEANLSQHGDCWIYDDAKVYDFAKVFDEVWIYNNAIICGNALIQDNARVFENSIVCGNAKIYGNTLIYENAVVYENAEVYKYCSLCCGYIYCIPYNDDTKHLVGTTEEAPEFYRYWED